jgi:hypothetical protein
MPLLLDGRALAGNGKAARIERGVALHLSSHDRGDAPAHSETRVRSDARADSDARVIVDQAGTLIRLEPETLEPLPRAVAGLRPFFAGVWRDPAAQQYLFCLRPRHQLPIDRFAWRRRIRRAALTDATDNARTM